MVYTNHSLRLLVPPSFGIFKFIFQCRTTVTPDNTTAIKMSSNIRVVKQYYVPSR